MLHILEAYQGELERNDFRRLLAGRAMANAVLGSERVFGFGSAAASPLPYAEVLTEVKCVGGRFMASEPHALDEAGHPRPTSPSTSPPGCARPPCIERVGLHP